MPSVSELARIDHDVEPLQSATETRRPMTGYEGVSDNALIDRVFDPVHPVYNNYQLRRELKYRLIERS